MTDNLSRGERLLPETLGFQVLPLRQFLLRQQSPGPIKDIQKPRKRGLHGANLLTTIQALSAVLVSLSPFVSKAPDFANLVRIFKSLIFPRYWAAEIRTFRIPFGCARGNEIEP